MSARRVSMAFLVVIGLILVVASAVGGAAPRDTVQAAPSAPSEQLILIRPEKDSWVNEAMPATNYGGDPNLRVGRWRNPEGGGVAERQILIQYDLSALPANAMVITATLQFYQTNSEGKDPWYIVWPEAIQEPWNEATVNWGNKPPSDDVGDPAAISQANSLWKLVDVTKHVKKWATGAIPNYGVLIRGDHETEGERVFIAKGHELQKPPILIIDYVLPTPTPTPTRTPTRTPMPTRTPTRTPTATPSTDLIAQRIEVTQGNQDLLNSVRLVRNKRTFVRFHVRSTSGIHSTWAYLKVQRGGSVTYLAPINSPSSFINVRPSPDRSVLNHAFLFELPSGFKEGNVTITAYLNPSHSPQETNYANNTIATNVSFETVPTVNVVLYRIGYRVGSTWYWPSAFDRAMMTSWLRRAYPVRQVNVWYRNAYYTGNGSVSDGSLVKPNCGMVNSWLWGKKLWDVIFSSGSIPVGAHYYGMVDDGGGFMRGCAKDIPHYIASGPTGSGTWGWDADGSYGDWYGGHELGHTYGRGHANYCGAAGGPGYPYPYGRISPVTSGNSAIYGFDISTRAIYGPTWKDVMTYCDYQWIGRFTYHGLMNFFQSHPVSAQADRLSLNQTDRLLVSGTIDPETNEVSLEPLYIIPDAGDVVERIPGDYAIVLRNGSGGELARYPFTPSAMDASAPMQITPEKERATELLFITELVPYLNGTTRVDIEGPGGTLLTSVTAGAGAPNVHVTSPNGGEVLNGDPITVSWTASDPDGDPLTYNVQYSPDNGSTWEMVAQNLTEKTVELDAVNIVSGTQGLFRVWASDGIHTASDTSDAPFTVPNHVPMVEITTPGDGVTVTISQTLSLEATAYDIETGTMTDEQQQWSSNLDGALGTGGQLSVAGLSVGTHTITFRGDDGQGGVATDTVQVTVVSDPDDLPALPDGLQVSPTIILLDPAWGVPDALISIENQNGENAIGWNGVAVVPWLQLSTASGTTPDDITVTFNDTGLAGGLHDGEIRFTSPAVPQDSVTVRVQVSIINVVYLPLLDTR